MKYFRFPSAVGVAAWLWMSGLCVHGIAAEGPSLPEPARVAAEVDALLLSEVGGGKAAASLERVNDETFLRRVSLDVIGRSPSIVEVTAFALDPAEGKRGELVEKLLADPRYGENWARYWGDVIMYRKTEERAAIVAGTLQKFLRDELNRNAPWSQIATAFITATGDGQTDGATALIIAQEGKPEETVSEISRIFLGVQIQCAQCHDHPTDRWKREQFHELAAFFPRVSSRIVLMPERREIAVVANDSSLGRFRGPMNMRRFGTPEHYMPDLKDPASRGKLMKPVFFVTGDSLPLGTKDADRRGELAKWITATDNPYFAKALVNRLWSELVGEGFYEPVDDIGPDRDGVAPQTLAYLAEQFTASGYDVKWLFRTILATAHYQLPSASRRNPAARPFAANVAQPLRADQLFDNVLSALDLSEPSPPPGGFYAALRFNRSPRAVFNQVFGYDPSQRRDEIGGSIPQALLMMNSPVINRPISAVGNTGLARLLREIKDDEALLGELYLKTLSREPTASEVQTCRLYIQEVNNRGEAFEDLLWSLVNSSEFLRRK